MRLALPEEGSGNARVPRVGSPGRPPKTARTGHTGQCRRSPIMRRVRRALAALLLCALPAFGRAQQADANAQANNPLASTTSLNLQNQFIGRLRGTNDSANALLLRGAQPFSVGTSNWIARATLPINTVPNARGEGNETGIGDLNVFAAYLFDNLDPGVSFGIGPQLTAPTATERALGSGQWSAGFANVLFVANNPAWQYGYLLTWQASIGSNDSRRPVNVGNVQPFVFRQLGEGWYLRSTGVSNYDFDNNSYAVPLGLGVGKVVKVGKTVMNLFVEPQYSVLRQGPGQSEWGIFAGINFQFRL